MNLTEAIEILERQAADFIDIKLEVRIKNNPIIVAFIEDTTPEYAALKAKSPIRPPIAKGEPIKTFIDTFKRAVLSVSDRYKFPLAFDTRFKQILNDLIKSIPKKTRQLASNKKDISLKIVGQTDTESLRPAEFRIQSKSLKVINPDEVEPKNQNLT